MIKSLLLLSFGLCFTAAAPLTVHAQGSDGFQKPFVEQLQLQFPDFRIVKKIEAFPERYNASVELPIRTSTSHGPANQRALVTLHDGVTGEPLESCFTPCSLHKSPGRLAFVFPYRSGHFTFPNEIEADPAGMREEYPFWDGKYEVKLGPDFKKAYFRGKMCEREFAKMKKTDRDAEPCYRMPPPVPDLEFSGYCKTVFDVSPKGKVINAKTTECSAKDFEITSLVAVSAWTYHPKIDRGMAVTRPDVEVTLRYDVTDYDGTLLDENGNRVEE